MKYKFYFLIALTVSVFNHLVNAQNDQFLNPIDIFNLEYVNNPKISPDREQIIYERNYFDIQKDRKYSNLWIINTDGTENRPITTGNQNDFNAIWSKDQNIIYFQSNNDGSTQIYKLWLDKGNIAKLSNTQKSQGGLSLSPDEQWIAFSMFVPEAEKFTVQGRATFGMPISVSFLGKNEYSLNAAKQELIQNLKQIEEINNIADLNNTEWHKFIRGDFWIHTIKERKNFLRHIFMQGSE